VGEGLRFTEGGARKGSEGIIDYSERMIASATLPRAPLVVLETHPIQYHAPVYRELQAEWGVPVTVIYGSDFSIAGYLDPEFGAAFTWDTDLLSGYQSIFLSRLKSGGAGRADEVSAHGMGAALRSCGPGAILLVGYGHRFHQAALHHSRQTHRPVLFRGETTDHAVQRSPMKGWVRSVALRLFYNFCSRLLYIGQRSREHFTRLGVPDTKLVFSPYCVDTTPFQCSEEDRARLRAETRRQLEIADDAIVLLFSGKLSARKGPDLLVGAVKALPADLRSRMVVLFLGSGEMQGALEHAAGAAPGIAVRFTGFHNQSHLSPYYHTSDLLVLPSRELETWGLVVNEALHHGLPCLVSDAVGCMPDLIVPGATGDAFDTGSIEAMRAGIQRALRLINRLETRVRCRERVGGYSAEKAAEGIAQAYHSVVHIHA
jgi:glycosyltransferase involved in cell wall biosynthesis